MLALVLLAPLGGLVAAGRWALLSLPPAALAAGMMVGSILDNSQCGVPGEFNMSLSLLSGKLLYVLRSWVNTQDVHLTLRSAGGTTGSVRSAAAACMRAAGRCPGAGPGHP